MEQNIIIAFLMTMIAGLSTGVGSIIAFATKQTNKKFLSISLGFSAGVMIYISMIEIFADAKATLIEQLGEQQGSWLTVISFFGGMLLIAMIDKLLPEEENPHDVKLVAAEEEKHKDAFKLLRTGTFTAIAIAVHNFPEGLATFISALQNPTMAIPIVVAIAIHNIPEGIAVSAGESAQNVGGNAAV